MIPALVVNMIKNRLLDFYYNTFFRFIQLPLWYISYNRNGNQADINGKLKKCSILIAGENNRLIIEKGVSLNRVSIKIDGSKNSLIIRSGVKIGECGKFIIEDENCFCVIGENTYIGSSFIAVRDNKTSVIIGKNCLFSSGITIRTSDAHSIMDMNENRINPGADVIIDNHVWIGYNATILKGCKIGRDSVVGTNSVCTNLTIPPNSVVAGVPAKIIRSNINWDIKRL